MAKPIETKKLVSRVKIKKKNWYRIIAPQSFGQQEIGETFLTDGDSAIGRKVDACLKELTGNIKDQNAYVSFRMVRAEGSVIHTEPIGYFLTASSVKRLIRKNISRLDDYFLIPTKAGESVIVKTIMITRSVVQRSVQKALRVKLKSILQEEFSKNDFNGFLIGLVGGKLRRTALPVLNKITPLKEAAIRVLSLKAVGGEPAPEMSSPSVAEETAEEMNDEEAALSEDADAVENVSDAE